MQVAPVHIPVLLNETIGCLNPRRGGVYVDCTVGAGGHARAILENIGPDGLLIGLDRDPAALAAARQNLAPFGAQVRLVHGNFSRLREALDSLGVPAVDGVLFDLGVSSLQLDAADRGFSYWKDAPLDMRMDPAQQTTAYHLVNGLTEDELAKIIAEYGEEKWARRIAQFIVRERQRKRIETTGELVEIIKAAIPAPARREGPHPARRTFQALRIAVNDELSGLGQAIEDAVAVLRPGGRICVITFHSLEDRVVKQTLRALAKGCICPPDAPVCGCGRRPVLKLLTTKPIIPGAAEIAANPRARSAKLRAAERLAGHLRVLRGGRGE